MWFHVLLVYLVAAGSPSHPTPTYLVVDPHESVLGVVEDVGAGRVAVQTAQLRTGEGGAARGAAIADRQRGSGARISSEEEELGGRCEEAGPSPLGTAARP